MQAATTLPVQRLIARTFRLSIPLTLVLLALLLGEAIAPLPAALGAGGGILLAGILALARERRLGRFEQRLGSLLGETQVEEEFNILGGDTLPVMLDRVEKSLTETRLRRDELDRLLFSLLDALPDPLLLVLQNRMVERGNRAAARLFETEPVDRPIESLLRDPSLLAALEDALEGGDEAEVNLQLPGPPPRAFGVRVVPCRWHAQQAVLISLRELTEQMAIERMRADFVANASHELRTPLTVLRGFIETLEGPAKDDPDARARFLKTMGAEAQRMSRLVDDLLSLSRIEQNEHVQPSDQVRFRDVVGAVIDSLRPYAEDRHVALELDLEDGLPPVIGDRDQLTQLFTNLIDNAVKYGGEGGKVRVQAQFGEAAPSGAGPLTGRPSIIATVADRGPGIAKEHLPRLTERFFRVDPALSRHLGGTGLGLAIVKHILRRHRGHMAIDSVPGQGTTVTVYLHAST
jgi:two-component system phosphate regulon sensor histidine kinase PhoR